MRARLRRPRIPRRPAEAVPEAAPAAPRVGLLHRTPDAPLRITRPGDDREREADRMAGRALVVPAAPHPTASGPGVLPEAVQGGFRTAFGEDLRTVRLHTGPGATALTRAAHAEAVTLGDTIALSPSAPNADTPRGRRLLAHEAAHVVQSRRGRGAPPVLARRMIVGGDPGDVSSLLALLGAPAGLRLVWDPSTREVAVAGPSDGGVTPSPSLAALLSEVIGHPTQDAVLWVAVDQPGIVVGGFPVPNDLTERDVQRVDIDDALALEAGAPGNGVAKVAHEIDENFRAHASAPRPGDNLYDPSHEHAVEVESDVAEELVGPGRRAAGGLWVFKDGVFVSADDFETYYLVTRMLPAEEVPGESFENTPVEIVGAERVGRIVLSTDTVDAFASGSPALPRTSADAVTAHLLQGDLFSTVRIVGHTDGVGSEASNEALGLRRAESARDAVARLVDAHLMGERIHVVSLGEREPVADDATEAGRAQNRRVEIEVATPDWP